MRGAGRSEAARPISKGLKKFGNDEEEADRWTIYVVEEFVEALSPYENTRGGRCVASHER